MKLSWFCFTTMAEQIFSQQPKRHGGILERTDNKLAKSTESDLLQIAREMWHRGKNSKVKAASTEDRDFREFFGCSLSVASEVWDMLQSKNLSPEDGTTSQYLWALMFMKIYGKEKNLCTLAGGVDKKTFRKWAWVFVNAIAKLEGDVVSLFPIIYAFTLKSNYLTIHNLNDICDN